MGGVGQGGVVTSVGMIAGCPAPVEQRWGIYNMRAGNELGNQSPAPDSTDKPEAQNA